MAAELVNCPECKRTLRVPSDLIGKMVKCPTCGHTFTGNAAVEEPPPAPPPPPPRSSNVKPPRTSKVGRGDEDDRDDEDEDEERARRRRLRASRDDDDDEDDDRRGRRRRRSRRDDDDDDYEERRPRRRREYLAPHRGSAILILGIVSFFFLPIILGPMAWIMGNNDLEQIRAGRMDPEGYGPTNAGRICGMISTLLWIGGVLLFIVICAGFMASAPSNFR